MSLRRERETGVGIVICDGCKHENRQTEHRTDITGSLVLAFYDATLRNDWVPGDKFATKENGVFCPACAEARGGAVRHDYR